MKNLECICVAIELYDRLQKRGWIVRDEIHILAHQYKRVLWLKCGANQSVSARVGVEIVNAASMDAKEYVVANPLEGPGVAGLQILCDDSGDVI